MKYFYSLVLLALVLTSHGQSFPESKTEQHLQVEGTNISMIPPANFEASSDYKGFKNPDDATSMIMVMEIPGPYSEITKGFNAEMLEAQGMKLTSLEEINLAGYSGKLIEIEQSANGIDFAKHILLYGDEKASVLINGVFPKEQVELGKTIQQSILTTYIDTELAVNPREALSYTVNEEAGGLKFVNVMGNGTLLNRDLKTPTESDDQASLIIDQSFESPGIQNKKQFCIGRLKKYPEKYSLHLRKGVNEIEIDGLKGFELYANNADKTEEIYQVILFKEEGGYYIIFGSYLNGSEQAIADIKNVVQSFRQK